MSGSDRSPRSRAAEILDRVERGGAFASILIDAASRGLSDSRDAALLRELVLGVLRRRGALDAAIGAAAERAIGEIDEELHAALRLGAYQLAFLRVPDHAAVDSSVRLVARPAARGFVNAVLRRIAREGLLPPEPAAGDIAALAAFGSHPRWWLERLVERVGWDRARAIVEANNVPAPPALVPNPKVIDGAGLAARAAEAGLTTEPGRWVPEMRVVTGGNLARSGLLDGPEAWVQDEAARLVPMLLDIDDGMRVADLCAAPGGKTACLAASAEASVVAVDRHPGRLARLERQLRRLGLDAAVRVVAHDLTSAPLPNEAPFDAILVDAPCSGSGTLRRHPEIRWRLTPEQIERLARAQARILDTAASMLAPGGALVYAVCSIEPEEGSDQLTAFCKRHPRFTLESAAPSFDPALVDERGCLATDPADGLDGFFAARLRAPYTGGPS